MLSAGPVHALTSALTPLLLHTGGEYHGDMNRRRRQGFRRDYSDRSPRADLLLREQPDEEEDEEEEEEEGNGTGNEGDEEEDDGGYSVQVYRLCQR